MATWQERFDSMEFMNKEAYKAFIERELSSCQEALERERLRVLHEIDDELGALLHEIPEAADVEQPEYRSLHEEAKGVQKAIKLTREHIQEQFNIPKK